MRPARTLFCERNSLAQSQLVMQFHWPLLLLERNMLKHWRGNLGLVPAKCGLSLRRSGLAAVQVWIHWVIRYGQESSRHSFHVKILDWNRYLWGQIDIKQRFEGVCSCGVDWISEHHLSICRPLNKEFGARMSNTADRESVNKPLLLIPSNDSFAEKKAAKYLSQFPEKTTTTWPRKTKRCYTWCEENGRWISWKVWRSSGYRSGKGKIWTLGSFRHGFSAFTDNVF